jgi:hypothetical protein
MTDERPQLTKSQAINNQWVIAYHRLTYAKDNKRPCRCEDCREHLAAMKDQVEA